MKTPRTTLIATAMVLLTACSTGNGTAGDPDATGTASATATTTKVDVEIVDFTFSPASFEVAVGEEVTWMNQDDFAHTVTAGEPNEPTGAFDGRLGESSSHASSGATFTTTFDEAGTYPYFCDLHPSMTGEIVVTGS